MASDPTINREVLVEVAVYHQRRDIKGCRCGWAVPGASWAHHFADMYEQAAKNVQAGEQHGGTDG